MAHMRRNALRPTWLIDLFMYDYATLIDPTPLVYIEVVGMISGA